MLSRTPVVKAIHDAVAVGNFSEAERLLDPYREQVLVHWRDAKSDSERKTIIADVNGLLDWARLMTLSGRAHAQNKLVLLRRESAYCGETGRPRSFSVEA